MALWLGLLCGVLMPGRSSAASGLLSIPGAVRVMVEPVEAVADGAGWSVDAGAFQSSGTSVTNLGAGNHSLTFQDLPGWVEPSPEAVMIIGGVETGITVNYRRLPRFYFREVPEQRVRIGSRLELVVHTDNGDDPESPGPGTALQLMAVPNPVGTLEYDAASGRISYLPVSSDRLPFEVRLVTPRGVAGSFEVTPLRSLTPEDSVLQYERPMPDDTSRDYMQISEIPRGVVSFNNATAETYEVSVSGQTLVFAEDHPAGLLRQFNRRRNLRRVNLYADKIIIRHPLVLPQTEVVIRARELHFEGEGRIDTTPLARTARPAGAVWGDNLSVGNPGYSGHDGGDVTVHVERFFSSDNTSNRFVLGGGDGGPGGEGRDGRNGEEIEFGSADWTNLTVRAGIEICGFHGQSAVLMYWRETLNGRTLSECGNAVPAKGENGVPAGVPGTGGRGGILRSTLSLGEFAVLAGGAAGPVGVPYQGGAPLTNRFIHRVTNTRIVNGAEKVTNEDKTADKQPGLAAAPPAGVAGQPGRVELLPTPGSWLHSYSVHAVVQYAKDAYLNGRFEEARRILGQYRELLRAYESAELPNSLSSEEQFSEGLNLSQLQTEIGSLIYRLDSNLDYFGNPAGWVPMLSFEANLLAFQNEVNQSVPILYLTYWLNHAATNLQASLVATEQARSGLEAERDRLETEFDEAQLAIPRLKSHAQSLAFRISTTTSNIAKRLAELEDRARRNVRERHRVPAWKKIAGALSVVAQLVPVGQPAVGIVGAGLGLLAQVDTEHPVESAKALAPQAMELSTNVNITFCFKTNAPPAEETSGLVALSEEAKETRKERLKRLGQCAKFAGSKLEELAAIFKTAKVDSEEMAAELEKLKAADVDMQGMAEEVESLSAEKEAYAQELAGSLQLVSAFNSSIAQNLVATHELEDRISARLNVLDHGALMHIKEMERRARDRMLKYQYLLAKAYQYRQLRPFNGNLQLNRLFVRFQQLVEANTSHVLSAADFETLKGIFISELRDLVAQSLDNVNAPSRSLPKSYRLNAPQRQQLNEQGFVLLNLKELGLINAGDENVRLADLRTRVLAARPDGPIGSLALMRLNYEHQGDSRLTTGGRTLLFRHYQSENVNPITWSAIHDGQTGQTVNSTLSAAQQSLIGVLLGQLPVPIEDVVLYSLPAANAEILLTKQVTSDNGIDFIIDDLLFEIQYDYTPTRSNVRELAVKVSRDLQPVIKLSQSDVNSRQDGQGDFLRVYSPFSQVTLEAPRNYGRFTFDRWVVNNQPEPSDSTTLSVLLLDNTALEARYRLEATDLVLVPVDAPAGQLRFEFISQAGSNYVLEGRGNLTGGAWTAVETRVGDGGKVQFTRPTGGAAASFFRVRVE